MTISRPVQWHGGYRSVPGIVTEFYHATGIEPSRLQIKYCIGTEALRLSDYHSRHTCEPGECFWMQDGKICGGDADDYLQAKGEVDGRPKQD